VDIPKLLSGRKEEDQEVIALFLPLVVITDPYKGIRHNEITVYSFKKHYIEKVIEITEPEKDESEDAWEGYLKDKYGTREDDQ
jgi:hypothetical protein